MLCDQRRHARDDLLPSLVRADRLERAVRDLDGQIEIAAMSDVHQLALAIDADQKMTDILDRLLRR